jgi:hypothetical protein
MKEANHRKKSKAKLSLSVDCANVATGATVDSTQNHSSMILAEKLYFTGFSDSLDVKRPAQKSWTANEQDYSNLKGPPRQVQTESARADEKLGDQTCNDVLLDGRSFQKDKVVDTLAEGNKIQIGSGSATQSLDYSIKETQETQNDLQDMDAETSNLVEMNPQEDNRIELIINDDRAPPSVETVKDV